MKELIKKFLGEKNYRELWECFKKPYLTKKAVRSYQIIDFKINKNNADKIRSYGDGIYGTYKIFDDYLDNDSIVYSFGIGMDASFDLSVIREHGCNIYAFDPDKHAIEYVEKNEKLHSKFFKFYPYAVSANGGVLRFYEHNREGVNDGSGSIYQYGVSTGEREVMSKTLKDIMEEFGHDHIDLLKMDIEGVEYELIDYIVDNRIQIKQIAMELHGRFFDDCREKNEKLVQQLKKGDYIPIWNQMWWYAGQECTFIHGSILEKRIV